MFIYEVYSYMTDISKESISTDQTMKDKFHMYAYIL